VNCFRVIPFFYCFLSKSAEYYKNAFLHLTKE
jgi:hypothetical protein